MWPPSSHEAALTTKHKKCNQEKAEEQEDKHGLSDVDQTTEKKGMVNAASELEQTQEELKQEEESQEDTKQEEGTHRNEQGTAATERKRSEGVPDKTSNRQGGDEKDGHDHSVPPTPSALPLPASVKRPTSLLDLPEELWIEIGKMVINDLPITIIQAIADVSTEYSERCGHIHYQNIDTLSPRPLPPAILQTSSALRRELRLVYFSEKIVIEISIRSAAPRLLLLDQYMAMVGRSACQKIKGVVRWGRLTKATHTPDPCYRGMWERNFSVVYGEAVRTEGWESDGLFWNVTFA
ncbi:unnamed protein product [Zymoseptoria tritici ST99CH_3D1]|nr:unnamed protein product [Zymoseptoria tritici ST99CH_3D1]